MDNNSVRLVANILMSYVGVGVLSLPYGFRRAGVLWSATALSTVCAVSVHCAKILVRCRNRLGFDKATHSDIALATLGSVGGRVMDVAFASAQLGFSSAYLLFIADNMASMVPNTDRTQWVSMFFPMLLALTMVRDLNSFAVFSLASQIVNGLAFAVAIWYSTIVITDAKGKSIPPFNDSTEVNLTHRLTNVL